MGVLALAPLAINPETQKQLRSKVENWTWLLLFAGAIAMTVFSGYLMYLLVFEIRVLCLYCLASALFTVSFLLLTVLGRDWRDTGQLLFIAIVIGMVTLISTLGVYASTNSPLATAPSDSNSTELAPAITTSSGQAETALANHLKQIDAKMYGAYWCPHCHEQKQLFGKAASSQINYIECDPGGANPQPDLCTKAGVQSYPAWEINGKLYPGTKDLPTLAKLSGYQGPQNFQNMLSRPQT
jgi:thiol-disulfide isomerase/thioredoxin